MTEKIKINGKEYPFKLGIRAFKEFAITYQGNANELDLTKVDEFGLIYLGFKYGHLREGLEFNISEAELEDLFDEDFKAYLKVVEKVAEAMPKVDVEKNEVSPKGKKKIAV